MNENELAGKTVIIGLSGGIDSAVAAYLLKKQGVKVTGLYLSGMTFLDSEEEEKKESEKKLRLKKLCDSLGIVFSTEKVSREFYDFVISPFLDAYLERKKDNGLYHIHKLITFILEKKRIEEGHDYFATGHFAKINFNHKSSEFSIHAGHDSLSDQSHLLSQIPQQSLKHFLLPLGDLKESDSEKVAKTFQFPFDAREQKYLNIELKEKEKIIKKYIAPSLIKKVNLIHIETGHYYLTKENEIYLELGMKNIKLPHGTNPDKDLEIVLYDNKKEDYYLGASTYLSFQYFQVENVSWPSYLDKNYPFECYVKIGEEKEFLNAKVYLKSNDACFVELEKEIYPLICGERASFYEKNMRSARLLGQGEVGARGKIKEINRLQEYSEKEESDDKENNLPFDFGF